MRLLDELESFHNHPHLTSNSGRVKNVEQVVAKEKKPVGHGKSQKLHKVEQIARNLNKRPTNGNKYENSSYLINISLIPKDC